MNILHISIADSDGGAAIAAERLNQIMNEDDRFSSSMLVLISNIKDKTIFSLGNFALQKARISNLLNNQISRFKNSYGLFSFGLLGNDISNNPLVIDADVIYIHWINNGMMSWNSIKKIIALNKPTFLFGHDMWYFTGGCHQSNGCEQYITGCSDCPFFSNFFFKNIAKNNFINKKNTYSNNFNVRHILPSSDFYDKAISTKIIDNKRINFIPNIIDTNKFCPIYDENAIIRPLKVLFGAMGGKSNPYKGWEDFVYFAENICKKYKSDVEIILFGYDFTACEIEKLPFKVISYGLINNENLLIDLYRDADVFVFPSNQESFGQTLFEAMSCGVVPISYDVGIAKDLILNNINGFLVDKGKRFDLVKAFDLLVSSNINDLKLAARDTITNKFSKQVILNKHIELINSMI